jgi:hypothetical protein
MKIGTYGFFGAKMGCMGASKLTGDSHATHMLSPKTAIPDLGHPAVAHRKGKGTAIFAMVVAPRRPSARLATSTILHGSCAMPIRTTGPVYVRGCSVSLALMFEGNALRG